MWAPQLTLADRGWRIIAPDLRGLGEASGKPAAMTMDDFAGDVIDLLDGLHIGDAVFGGLSLGGYVTFALMRHVPGYFRGLILADTRPQADTPEALENRRRMRTLATTRGPAAIADEMIPKLLGDTTRSRRPEVADRVRGLITANSAEGIAGAIDAMMSRQDAQALLSSIRVPTLVLVGDEDTLTPPALSEEMHRNIPGAELVVIEGAGHLSNLEQPDRFNDALGRFLDHRI
jgi:3-oxoadipate enol-lactonase